MLLARVRFTDLISGMYCGGITRGAADEASSSSTGIGGTVVGGVVGFGDGAVVVVDAGTVGDGFAVVVVVVGSGGDSGAGGNGRLRRALLRGGRERAADDCGKDQRYEREKRQPRASHQTEQVTAGAP